MDKIIAGMDSKTVLCATAIVFVLVAAYYFLREKRDEKYDYVVRELPTSPEVELIEGRPDFDVVSRATGDTVIRQGDIALSPAFGVGEGTVGFGRFGSSFMV